MMMIKKILQLIFILLSSVVIGQTGHLMQGIGAVNMSMGGAATAQPLDISGALQWNPAALAVFDGTHLKLDAGAFFSSPELYSSLPPDAMFKGSPRVSGLTKDERGVSMMPALALSWGDDASKSRFAVSAFGVSGFGVTFPQETNLPGDNWDPSNSNPITYPQSMNGFGHIESDYMLLQVGFTWSYAFSDRFSIGLQPTFNYANLSLEPNPLATPTNLGYPNGEASATGFGGQIGLFYDSLKGIKLGLSYKTPQFFSKFDFGDNTQFQMDYPAIYSFGFGYSKGIVDFALDYRYVDYEGTEGFKQYGWTQFGSVRGFGWKNISILSTGIQLKAIDRLPLRFGYTFSSNPIDNELAMFSVPATAIIAHAFQFGLSYKFTDNFKVDAVYHYGMSDGATEGQILNPMLVSSANPLGKLQGSTVGYEMTTSMVMLGLNFNLGSKDTDGDGVKDKEDNCPEIAGLKQFNGCPDSDGDGVQDGQDQCVNEPGLAKFNGCPDSDGDGFADREDMCPDVAGLEQFNGCPDSDGDGVMDPKDNCPNEAGPIENSGCPYADADNDGVNDNEDNCPHVFGTAANNGCPLITEQIQKEITDLARSIYFNTGKDSFTDETKIRLEGIGKILAEYRQAHFIIEGHTDSTGSDKINKALSEKRAVAVKNYLIENGFPAENLTAKGFGSSQPIGDNKTRKGRQANRRVEIYAKH